MIGKNESWVCIALQVVMIFFAVVFVAVFIWGLTCMSDNSARQHQEYQQRIAKEDACEHSAWIKLHPEGASLTVDEYVALRDRHMLPGQPKEAETTVGDGISTAAAVGGAVYLGGKLLESLD